MKKEYVYDSRYDSSKKQGTQEVIELILNHKYGETIGFEVLSKMLGYNFDNELERKKFKGQMSRIKNFLVDKGYVLKSITGVGYYILKPKQISGYCYHTYIRKTQSLLEKSDRILTHTDTFELSQDRLKEYSECKNLNHDVYENIGNTIYYSDYQKNKNYYDNLED